jgi:ABC-type transport system involved in multi-copper enzyme maturation permease subunit
MFKEFLRFDLRYQFRSPVLWIVALVFSLLAFAAITSDGVQIGGAIGNVHRNSPAVITGFLGTFTVLGMFVAVAFVALPLLRDFDLGTDELFFSTPMRRSSYVWGRVTAGFIAALAAYALVALVVMVGTFMPWLDPDRLGPFSLRPYLWSFGVIIVPNLVFISALLALLAVTTRRLLIVFVGAISFIVLWMIAGALTRDIQYDQIAALIDPFGVRTIARITRYWSVAERNSQLPDLSGWLLTNRLLWLGVAALMIVAVQALFKPQRPRESKKRWLGARAETDQTPAAIATPAPIGASRAFDTSAAWRQCLQQMRFDTVAVLKSIPFLVLLAFGVLNFIGGARTLDSLFGTNVYPVTSLMLEAMQGSYQFLLILIITYYAGDIVWKERDAKVADVTDAMPVPNWVPLFAKLGAMIAVVLVFMLVGALTGIGYQLFNGYTNLELGLYARGLLVDSLPFVLMAGAAIFLQVLCNQKFLGYLSMIVLLLVIIILPTVHLEHNLYIFAGAPVMVYSDMNGYGHLLGAWAWFQAYWTLFVAMLVILASAFWTRGVAQTWRSRWRQALAHLRGGQGAALALFAVAFVAVGGWIFYNTAVVNEYLPADAVLDRQARFEREYKKYEGAPQPRIAAVRADVDIYPEERRATIRGNYRIVNKHPVAIRELHVFMNPAARLQIQSLDAATLKIDDPQTGFRLYELQQPLAPGAAMDFAFTVERAERGFTNSGMPPSAGPGDVRSPLNYNGTFFNSIEMMPHFGYNRDLQILDRNERRKRDLGDVPRMAKLEDESARDSLGFPDADWVDFETTVSTSEDQIALAPGYLQREWVENGRRYFHYKMDQPMLPFYCYLSAAWKVKRGDWHGVPIEVYYDPAHPYNVDRMILATQESLDYFTANFSPYQHRQVRILEFPRYARFAQSFANTIPFSESIGFIADLRDPDDIDYVYYVTAHEVAHQWWAHQVIGADVQGSTMIVESLAQYSALMVMEQKYGREHMRRFLKYELDRYLRGRGGELIEELPLMRVENQPYIHYSKGSLVFYRLREEIGEEALNRALANFIRDKAFQQPPYTTTLEMLDYIRAQTPPEKQTLIDELFAKIVFYDNRVVAARASKREDGKFDVEIDYEAAKRESDGLGEESPLAMNDWMQVGVFARDEEGKESDERALHLQHHHISAASGTIKLVVDSAPYEVGLDPYNKLIDRIPDDNRKAIE